MWCIKKQCLGLAAALLGSLQLHAEQAELLSPDKQITVKVEKGDSLSIEVMKRGERLYRIGNIAMRTDLGNMPGTKSKIQKTSRTSVSREHRPVVREQSAVIRENYNQLRIDFRENVSVEIRAYNEGVAYRFVTTLKDGFTVYDESATYSFNDSCDFTFQRDNNPGSSCEEAYVTEKIGKLTDKDMCNLPALVSMPASCRVVFLEADINDYPVMWLKTVNGALNMHHWNYPAGYSDNDNYYNKRAVTRRCDYIARVEGSRSFPWRVMAIADKDVDLLSNRLTWLLGEECRVDDTSWIKTGWTYFDWWGRWGVSGVDFKAGLNTETAKYMIDFSAEYGISYFLIDDGWNKGDLLSPKPDVNIEEIAGYCRSKGVDLMLWVSYHQLYDRIDEAFEQFEKWGVKGVKIDFMARFDQEMVRFYREAAQKAARHHLVVNFHGAYCPDGLSRTYPNVLTREALAEFEMNGVSDRITPEHDCTLPFIRNVAGSADYIPGTMLNASRRKFRPIGDTPLGQGTRAHSMAMAVISYSPMQMVPDAPTVYYAEDECARFLFSLPVVWDETRALSGKVGEHIAIARRSGEAWYVGAITNWDPRTLSLDFDFLTEGETYRMEIIRDGINAATTATDYKHEVRKVKKSDSLPVDLSAGGGWIAKILPENN